MRTGLTILWSLAILNVVLACGTVRAAEQPATTPPKSKPAITSSESHADPVASPKAANAKGKVDLNSANAEELEALPGVGPSTAQAIIKARPFKNVNELTNVAGIGPSKLAALKSHVTVKSAASKVKKANRGDAVSGAAGGVGSATEKSSGKPPAVTPGTAHERASSTSPTSKPSASQAQSQGQKVNLNTATLEQLQELPGIGPVKAQAIIDARPFNSPEDVMKVKGIKEGVFGEIKDQITVK